MQPLINILIRTSQRKELFQRCINSITKQTYKNYRVIVSNDRGADYIPEWCQTVTVTPGLKDYYWNLYCNELKEQVKDGWFFFLDDDDMLIDSTALARISAHMINQDEGIICQFTRWGRRKPSTYCMNSKQIMRGKIGMPCIFLHHSQKGIAYFDDKPAADYRFIKEVSGKIKLNFVHEVVVETDRISKGRAVSI